MILIDVNILVYAFREDSPNHRAYKDWLERVVNSDEAFGITNIVLGGFLRIVTHPSIFKPPSAFKEALPFVEIIRARPNCVVLAAGARHWEIFVDLCKKADVKGNLVADAHLAAIAIEHGCEWISADRDFARFPGLRWRHPLQS